MAQSIGGMLPAMATRAQARAAWIAAMALESAAVRAGWNLPGQTGRVNTLDSLTALADDLNDTSRDAEPYARTQWETLRGLAIGASGDAGATTEGAMQQDAILRQLGADLVTGIAQIPGQVGGLVGGTVGGLLGGLGYVGWAILGAVGIGIYIVVKAKGSVTP